MELNFAEIAKAVKENNMGLGGISVSLKAEGEGSSVKAVASGQRFALSGQAPPAGAAWRTLRVLDWTSPKEARVEIVP